MYYKFKIKLIKRRLARKHPTGKSDNTVLINRPNPKSTEDAVVHSKHAQEES